MQATETHPSQTASHSVSRHGTVQIQGDGVGANKELPIPSSGIPAGNGENSSQLSGCI